MHKYLISVFFGTLVIVYVTACSIAQKSTQPVADNITVLSTTYTPIIKGAGSPRGVKINVKAIGTEKTTIDSIRYESMVKPVDIVKKHADTLWVEASFHPVRSIDETSAKEFTANSCDILYHNSKKTGSITIKNMELRTDTQFWK